jgi:hypothetical protein
MTMVRHIFHVILAAIGIGLEPEHILDSPGDPSSSTGS